MAKRRHSQVSNGKPNSKSSEKKAKSPAEGVAAPGQNCHHYEHISEVPWDIQKYWQQRFSIFSKYDDGILMTDDAWFGVTPEPVAKKIATDITSLCHPSKTIIIDIFAGAGGNAIAFALSNRWTHVYAIEKDLFVLTCARANAAIYGVQDKITFIHGDSFEIFSNASKQLPEAITPESTYLFASPPWGGPSYNASKIFDLSVMQPYSLGDIEGVWGRFDHALFLPRTADLRQIAGVVGDVGGEKGKVDVVQYCMEGAAKGLVAYLRGSESGRDV